MKYESSYEKYYGLDPYNPGNTLSQHGIIGMKWGHWNEETRARYLGLNRRKKSSSNEMSSKKPKSEMGGLFNRGFKRTEFENKDLSSLPESEKKKIDKKYFKESSITIKTRVKDKNGHYTDKWITKKVPHYVLEGKKIVKDLDDDFFNKIDEEKNIYKQYEKNHSFEKNWVKALDDYWYGRDFSLNMFPLYLTESEFRKEMKDHWAKGMDDSTVDRIYKYMIEKTNYADKVESICKDEARRLGISDSKLNTAAYDLYGAFVDPEQSSKDIARQLSHSDFSADSYYATDPYDSRTTVKQHGVIGMKWGVWNQETRARYLGSGSKSKWFSKITDRFSKNKQAEEPHLKRTHLTKELENISDAELNAAIKRMQLEQTYLNMIKNYPDASDKGKKYADKFTDQLFSNLSDGLGGAMGRRIAKAIDSWFDDDSAEKEKRKKYEAEARRKSDDEIKKRNARDTIVNQYVKNRLEEDKNK